MSTQNEAKHDAGPETQPSPSEEFFDEVALFDTGECGSGESADCGCFNCDGNPCVKIFE